MLWQENVIFNIDEGVVSASMTLRRKSDGYTVTTTFTSKSSSMCFHLLATVGPYGYHADGEVLTICSDLPTLAMEFEEVLERLKVQVMLHYSTPGKLFSVISLMAMIRRVSEGIIDMP